VAQITEEMMNRSAACLQKLERMNKTLRHQEADRVPISDFFWGSFLERWRTEMGLPKDADIYRYYDLDWIVTIPNMDPHIKSFEILEENGEEVIVRTGFEAVIRKKFADPMPAFLSFDTDDLEKLAAFRFDDPWDERRYLSSGDNQLAGVGDGFARNLPPWIDTVKSLHHGFPVYGSVCEAHEMLWRIIGSENVLMWVALYPDELARFIERLHEFNLGITEAQIEAAGGLLDGMVIWGDVAYTKDMLFSPEYWRRHFKPGVRSMIELCHRYGLPVIYHGCGNVKKIFADFIEMGLESYNPLEAKAGLDVVELRREYGHRIGFCGNMDVRAWAEASPQELEAIVLRKLNAAKGGGWIFQSDHSVPSNVSAESYDTVVKLVREYGRYPLKLGEHDMPELG
jgi:uroporphyrinogen decarboxylase